MWWDIIKSTRGEAYQNFLDSLFAGGFQDEIPEKEGRKLGFMEDPWFVVANDNLTGIEIYGMTDELNEHREFITGMFEQEYPKDYQELKIKILKLIAEKRSRIITKPEKLPDFRSIQEKRKFLKQHIFTVNGEHLNNTGTKRRLFGSLISYYDGLDNDEVEELLQGVPAEAFNHTNNLKLLFNAYDDAIDDYHLTGPAVVTQDSIMVSDDRVQVVRDILEGKLNEVPYFKSHFGRFLPFGVKRISESEED